VNLGDWDTAIIKSISFVALGVAVCTMLSGSLPTTVNDFYGVIVSFLMFFGIYLVISIIGWLLIGFPIHWLISKYTKNGPYLFYILLPLCFVLLDLLFNGSLLFSLVAFFQALTFRYWVYKIHNKQLKRNG